MKMIDGLNNLEECFLVVIHFLLALLVGGVKELSKLKSMKFSFVNLISGMAVSSVSGVTAYLLLDYYMEACQLKLVGAIVAGWSGGLFINYVSVLYQKKIGKMMNTEVATEEEKELINND